MKPCLFTFLLVCVVEVVTAQDSVYVPGKTYNWKSRVLLSRLSGQIKYELDRQGITELMPMRKKYLKIHDNLQQQLKDSLFLDHAATQRLLDETYLRLRDANPGHLQGPKTFLAYRYPLPNAYCVGEGTTLVTTSMLARLQNQSQVAAVLAHELAHYELNHVYKHLLIEEQYEYNKNRPAPKVSGDPVVDKAREVQQRTADLFERYRAWELEADSLGFMYFSKAGFKQSEYVTMLTTIDPGATPVDDVPSAFFAPLHFVRYPFKEEWLKPRASIFRKSALEFFLPEDLMRTHPELQLRAAKILPKVEDKGQADFVPKSYMAGIRLASMEESALAAGRMRTLDLALHEVLFGLNELPHDPYYVTAMGRLLLRLATVIKDNLRVYYQAERTIGYDARMLLANNFINNVTSDELAQLGYHFMNQKENFRAELEEHYFLLWQFCQLTDRPETMKAVRQEYLERYPDGVYRKRMKSGNP